MRASEIRPGVRAAVATAANNVGYGEGSGYNGSRATRAIDEATDSVLAVLVTSDLVEADPEPEPVTASVEGGADHDRRISALETFARRHGFSG